MMVSYWFRTLSTLCALEWQKLGKPARIDILLGYLTVVITVKYSENGGSIGGLESYPNRYISVFEPGQNCVWRFLKITDSDPKIGDSSLH